MKNYHNNNIISNLPLPVLQSFNEFVEQEIEMFFTALQVNGNF